MYQINKYKAIELAVWSLGILALLVPQAAFSVVKE
jgi:hypothetical protein